MNNFTNPLRYLSDVAEEDSIYGQNQRLLQVPSISFRYPSHFNVKQLETPNTNVPSPSVLSQTSEEAENLEDDTQESSIDADSTFEEMLIEEVRKHACIWKKSSNEYRNKIKQSLSWKDVASKLEVTGN